MSLTRFANFLKMADTDKHGILYSCPSQKSSQISHFKALLDRFANFVFLTLSPTLILSASAKTQKPQKFANPPLQTKSKSICELFLKVSCPQNRAWKAMHPLQLSKSASKKGAICELFDGDTIKAKLKRAFDKITHL